MSIRKLELGKLYYAKSKWSTNESVIRINDAIIPIAITDTIHVITVTWLTQTGSLQKDSWIRNSFIFKANWIDEHVF